VRKWKWEKDLAREVFSAEWKIKMKLKAVMNLKNWKKSEDKSK